MTVRLRGGVRKSWLYLSYLKVCVKICKTVGNACNTPSSRLQTLKLSTCTQKNPTACGERKRDKPQERSRTRVMSNTSRQKHLLLSVFSSTEFLHFSRFRVWIVCGRLPERKLTRIFLGETLVSTYNIISTCRLFSKISFIVIRLPTTIRNIVGRKKGCHSIVMCPTVWFYSH